jgi:hypothetical protein
VHWLYFATAAPDQGRLEGLEERIEALELAPAPLAQSANAADVAKIILPQVQSDLVAVFEASYKNKSELDRSGEANARRFDAAVKRLEREIKEQSRKGSTTELEGAALVPVRPCPSGGQNQGGKRITGRFALVASSVMRADPTGSQRPEPRPLGADTCEGQLAEGSVQSLCWGGAPQPLRDLPLPRVGPHLNTALRVGRRPRFSCAVSDSFAKGNRFASTKWISGQDGSKARTAPLTWCPSGPFSK